jgi:hypothetical protein
VKVENHNQFSGFKAAVLVTACLATLAAGCNAKAPTAPGAGAPSKKPAVYDGPSKVEISGPTAEWGGPAVVQFKIPYRFTSGGPAKTYLWKIHFPGSTATGNRPTEAWEMEVESVQNTGIQVGDADVKTFTVELWEAETPDRPYYLISNVAEGTVPPRASDANAKSAATAK